MRFSLLKIALLFIGVGLGFFSACGQKNPGSKPSNQPVQNKGSISFDKQLEVFSNLGFKINPDIEAEVLDSFRSDKLIEEEPYSFLYMELGRTIEREPWTPLTDRCWDFDTEAIEDHGAYVEIMKNLERISRGEIKFENLRDYVDVEEGKAWVSFSIKGVKYKWDLKVDDDWVDPALFTKVTSLTKTLETKGKYTYFDTGGQN
jgi:hypothetical protein